MNILFLVTSFWAYGELMIACEFAERVKAAGFEPIFLIPQSHEKILKQYGFPYTTLIPRSGSVNRILMKDLEVRYRPALVILADFLNYNFCETHYGLTYDDLHIFSGRLGTFDDFDWELTGTKMDTYGFKARRFGEIDIKKYGFRLRPCPIVNPLRQKEPESDTFCYRLIKKTLDYNKEKTGFWKRELGLPEDKQMVLFTSATWQETYKQYPEVISFVEAANKVFAYCLKQLTDEFTVVYIGPNGYFTTEENRNLCHIKQLPPAQFDQYLMAADLFLSRNITSTTLAKVVLSGIPTINMKNSIFFKDDLPDVNALPFPLDDYTARTLSGLTYCYPYRMFPVGWYNFLSPVIKGNPYILMLKQVEQFDVTGFINTAYELLENGGVGQELAVSRSRYFALLDQLPSVKEIITQLVSHRSS